MTIGILKETGDENRVALLPETVKQLKGLQVARILVETGAGLKSFASDEDYQTAGAEIAGKSEVCQQSDVLIRINPFTSDELSAIKSDAVLLSVFQALGNASVTDLLTQSGFTTFRMVLLQPTTRPQCMIWTTSLPPSACTASATLRQPSICASL